MFGLIEQNKVEQSGTKWNEVEQNGTKEIFDSIVWE
jgi:hypothetical protein